MKIAIERCSECGSPLTGDVCGNCAPTGAPLDKGERRLEADEAEHEKERWDLGLVERKIHPRKKKAEGASGVSHRDPGP